jgi:GNAT superfamily N-acetyltransferase
VFIRPWQRKKLVTLFCVEVIINLLYNRHQHGGLKVKKLKKTGPERKGIEVFRADSRQDIRRFIQLQYDLYKGDDNFVAPLRMEMKGIVTGKHNSMLKRGPFERYIAFKDGCPAGRVIVGIDEELNRKKGYMHGYLSLFECIEDYEVAKALLDKAAGWLREKGITYVQGPVSPTGGDDYRGFLYEGFDSPPVLMNSYNFKYYNDFFDRYGFKKWLDLYAFRYDLDDVVGAKRDKAVEYAMKRYGFTADPLDLDNIEGEIKDIKRILDIAMPEEWEDMTPPSLDTIREFASVYRKLAEPDLIYIARTEQGEPIGFSVALPNYNEIFIKMKGRLFPFGFLKLLTGKKHIKSGRIFILFVVPEYRKKGVSGVIFYKSLKAGMQLGYTWGEGSTIGETNRGMIRDAEGAGGKRYKIYRIYGLELG